MLIAKADTNNSIDIFRRASTKSEPVVFSTDTIYGIGAPVSDVLANEKIFDIKGRESGKPFPVLAASIEQAENLAEISEHQKEMLGKIWPDTVTVILKAKPEVHSLFTLNGTIAIRVPATDWLRGLLSETGPVSATSANLSGCEYKKSISDIISSFSNTVHFFIFDNNINSTSSTIIDLTGEEIVILREGENLHRIKNLL